MVLQCRDQKRLRVERGEETTCDDRDHSKVTGNNAISNKDRCDMVTKPEDQLTLIAVPSRKIYLLSSLSILNVLEKCRHQIDLKKTVHYTFR